MACVKALSQNLHDGMLRKTMENLSQDISLQVEIQNMK
jgi:hypothetical protein